MEVRYLAAMAEFVLVPGAWLGALAWNAVVPELRSAGHGAHPVTLSGLADKQGVPAGLADEQIARIVGGSTPHPGDTLTEPAIMERSIGELPVTYIKCLLDSPEPSATVAKLLSSERWRLVTMDTGHWPML
jgi:hypothetical protein